MKKHLFFLYLAAVALLALPASCEKNPEEVTIFDVTVQLDYPEGFDPAEGITVTLRNINTGDLNEDATDADGVATFKVVAGIYQATASDARTDELFRYTLNGASSNITVTDLWTNSPPALITLTLNANRHPEKGEVSPYGKLIIKELYIGGCQKDNGSGAFIQDPYIIVYNNSTESAVINNLSLGGIFPSNAHATNYFYENGQLTYTDYLPAHFGVWQIHHNDTLAPGEQILIAINGAIDHTQTHSNSVNLANADYYVCYDIEKWSNATYYPAPSELIPTSHYLTAYKFPRAAGNAWILSTISPAAFIFTPPDDIELGGFADIPENLVYHSSSGAAGNQVGLKVPTDWVLDGIEVFGTGRLAESKERFTPGVNVGYIEFTNNQGHTLYRNVDKTATEDILGNAGKLVYNYSLGFGNSTDPSGIDAEASIKRGAHIIYKETNDTAKDFHQRSRASLKD
jgi:hypothetical protein